MKGFENIRVSAQQKRLKETAYRTNSINCIRCRINIEEERLGVRVKTTQIQFSRSTNVIFKIHRLSVAAGLDGKKIGENQ